MRMKPFSINQDKPMTFLETSPSLRELRRLCEGQLALVRVRVSSCDFVDSLLRAKKAIHVRHTN